MWQPNHAAENRIVGSAAMMTFVVFLLCFLFPGCDTDSPTAPTPPPTQPPPVEEPTPEEPPPTAPTGPTTRRTAKDSFEMRVLANNGNVFRVEATNITELNIPLTLTCYVGPPDQPEKQKLFSSGGTRSMGAGSTAVFECEVACGQGQADLHEGEVRDPPVGWARDLAMGRATQGSGPRCAPPPPPPPPPVCDYEDLSATASQECEHGFILDREGCSFTCKPPPPTCEELNPPSHIGFTYNVSHTHITASYTAKNEGNWWLQLYAGSPNNPRRYRKKTDDARLDCGETEHLSISYRHRGHGSCLWTLVASGPGLNFEQVVLDRCND